MILTKSETEKIANICFSSGLRVEETPDREDDKKKRQRRRRRKEKWDDADWDGAFLVLFGCFLVLVG